MFQLQLADAILRKRMIEKTPSELATLFNSSAERIKANSDRELSRLDNEELAFIATGQQLKAEFPQHSGTTDRMMEIANYKFALRFVEIRESNNKAMDLIN